MWCSLAMAYAPWKTSTKVNNEEVISPVRMDMFKMRIRPWSRSMLRIAMGTKRGHTVHATNRNALLVIVGQGSIDRMDELVSASQTKPSENCCKAKNKGIKANMRCSGDRTLPRATTPAVANKAPAPKLADAEKHMFVVRYRQKVSGSIFPKK